MKYKWDRIYLRCTYCGYLAFVPEEGECEDCGYTGVCQICGDTLEDETRRGDLPQICADPHCRQEWNGWETAE